MKMSVTNYMFTAIGTILFLRFPSWSETVVARIATDQILLQYFDVLHYSKWPKWLSRFKVPSSQTARKHTFFFTILTRWLTCHRYSTKGDSIFKTEKKTTKVKEELLISNHKVDRHRKSPEIRESIYLTAFPSTLKELASIRETKLNFYTTQGRIKLTKHFFLESTRARKEGQNNSPGRVSLGPLHEE